MLTTQKLNEIHNTFSQTREQQIIDLLYFKYRGACTVKDLITDTGLSRSTLITVHIGKSVYIEYDKETKIVSLKRKGIDLTGKLLFTPPDKAGTIGAYVFSLLYYDYGISFEDTIRLCKAKFGSIGNYARSKTNHYSYYKKLVKKYKQAKGIEL